MVRHTADAINRLRENPRYLPGIRLDEGVKATTDLAAVLAGAECVLLVTPAQALRATCDEASAHMPTAVPAVIAPVLWI